MRLSSQSFELANNGILIRGPQGTVHLSSSGESIRAIYIGNQLVNGSAKRYADQLKRAAVDYADSIPLPWTYDNEGAFQIKNHAGYYEQTFSTQLIPVETLKTWLSVGSRI